MGSVLLITILHGSVTFKLLAALFFAASFFFPLIFCNGQSAKISFFNQPLLYSCMWILDHIIVSLK